MVPAERPVAACENATNDVPAGTAEPPLSGTRVPNESLQVPGLTVPRRNHPVVAAPPGFTEPVRVAEVPVRLLVPEVDTVGAAGSVVKVSTAPLTPPMPGAAAGQAPHLNVRVTVPGKATLDTKIFLPDSVGGAANKLDKTFDPLLAMTLLDRTARRLTTSFNVILDL